MTMATSESKMNDSTEKEEEESKLNESTEKGDEESKSNDTEAKGDEGSKCNQDRPFILHPRNSLGEKSFILGSVDGHGEQWCCIRWKTKKCR